jgi:hypothetical protein
MRRVLGDLPIGAQRTTNVKHHEARELVDSTDAIENLGEMFWMEHVEALEQWAYQLKAGVAETIFILEEDRPRTDDNKTDTGSCSNQGWSALFRQKTRQ